MLILADRTTIHKRDDVGYTPLHLACSRPLSVLFTSRQVRDRGLKYPHHQLNPLADRPNNEAVALEVVQILLDAGADPNAVTSSRIPWTPMHCVANSGWMGVASLLLERGGSAFSRDMCSPYCWAASEYGQKRHYSFLDPNGPTSMKQLLGFYLSREHVEAINVHHLGQGFTGGLVYPVFVPRTNG